MQTGDSDHGVWGHYCNKGLIRFVMGDYAWAMANAMMVGYTKKGYTVSAKLIPALQDWPDGSSASSVPRSCPHSKATLTSEAVHLTDHSRTFKYPRAKQPAPDITVRHLWLKRD